MNPALPRNFSAGLAWLFSALFALLFLCATARATTPTLAAPEKLRCEYLENPAGIDTAAPRLGWINVAHDTAARALSQSSYQILVASSPEKLARDTGDLWDTGKVPSAQSLQIPYQGAGVRSHQPFHWKVRVWDQHGTASAWSAPAAWSLGLLDQREWTAEWIGRDDGKPLAPQVPLDGAQWIWLAGEDHARAPVAPRFFRKTFTLPAGAGVASAVAAMTADDVVTLFVNGRQALRGEHFNVIYEADIAPLLVPGKNVLAVEVRNGAPGHAALIGAVQVKLRDGRTISLKTDATWTAAPEAPANWQTGDTAAKWADAAAVGDYGIAPWGRAKPRDTYLPASYLRKDFDLARKPARAVLYVTALGHVEPHLNGARVGVDYLTPGWTDYKKRLYYKAYDVTALLRPGKNTLGAILGDGWFRGNISILGPNRYGTKTRARAQLHIFDENGAARVIGTDGTWQAAFGPVLESDMFAGETYDARREMPGWDTPAFRPDTAAWRAVDTGAEFAPEKIEAYPGEPIRALEARPAQNVTSPRPGLKVFDFGVNFAGWVRLKINAPAGTRIVMRFGEMLSPDGTVYRVNLRSARATDTYVCKGGGVETWEPHFTFHGFQYVEVEGLPANAAPDALTGVVVHSNLARVGAFDSASEIATRTADNMRWSIRSNSFEIPTDCPQRDERMGWMDYLEIARSAAYELDQSALLTKWVTDMVDGRLADGGFPQMAPAAHANFGWTPGWADSAVLIPYTMFLVQNDTRLCEKWFDEISGHIAYYEKRSPDYIAPAVGYGDWLAFDQTTPKDLVSTALFARCAFAMGEMSAALGRDSDAARFRDLFQNIRAAFQKKFVLADGTVGSNSQGSYLLPLAFDLLDEPARATAAEKLVAAIRAKDNHLSTGMVCTHLLLPTLTKIGRTDVAYEILEQKTLPSWGFFLEKGATSIWERWDSKTDKEHSHPMNSYNHANLGTCTEWFYRTVLGIDLLEPGFGKIRVKPEPGKTMPWARGHYDSPRGRIATDWKIANGAFALNVTIPPNTTAEVHIPDSANAEILENGRPVETAAGVSFLRVENGAQVFQVGSGTYAFGVKTET